MNCPVDGATLQMTERQGIEIDYCPTCRGVWLDRGELDKMIDRAAGASAGAASGVGTAGREPVRRDRDDRDDRDRDFVPPVRRDDDDDDDRRRYEGDYRKKSKRRSLLDDLFDFD